MKMGYYDDPREGPTTRIAADPLEFVFAVKDAAGSRSDVKIEFLENGYVRIKTSDAHHTHGAFLVQWINDKWHRRKLSVHDGIPDVCPAHRDGRHHYDQDAMTSREMLLSHDVRVGASIAAPKKCSCGQVLLPGVSME